MPAATPVIVPVAEPAIARVGSLLLHVPPLIALPSVVAAPMHTDAVPLMAPGACSTVWAPPVAMVPKVVRRPDVVTKSAVVIGLTMIVLPAVADGEMSAVIQ